MQAFHNDPAIKQRLRDAQKKAIGDRWGIVKAIETVIFLWTAESATKSAAWSAAAWSAAESAAWRHEADDLLELIQEHAGYDPA